MVRQIKSSVNYVWHTVAVIWHKPQCCWHQPLNCCLVTLDYIIKMIDLLILHAWTLSFKRGILRIHHLHLMIYLVCFLWWSLPQSQDTVVKIHWFAHGRYPLVSKKVCDANPGIMKSVSKEAKLMKSPCDCECQRYQLTSASE